MKSNIAKLLLLVLILFTIRIVVAWLTPVFDTSEARYAAISANMARTGDYVVPRFTYKGEYQTFEGKPPLLYQLGAVGARIIGVNEFAVRLPSLTFTAIILYLVWVVTKLISNKERAVAAVFVTFTSVAYYMLSGLCMMDALLVSVVAGAILSHVAFIQTGNRNWTLSVFILLAIGMLIKGPVAIVEFGLPVFIDTCINKRWGKLKNYRWFSGLALFFMIATPWFALMTRENPGFLKYFFINENLLRFLVHDYGDKYGAGRETFRGMSFIWAIVVTLPWPLLVAYRKWKTGALGLQRGNSITIVQWGIIAITAFWALTSRVPLPYLMPIVPLFAVWLLATASDEEVRTVAKVSKIAALITVMILIVTVLCGMMFGDKMLGEKAPYHPKRYSYEFYHGTPSGAKLK